MNDSYNPKNYWEERLNNRFNLQGVGHICFSEHYNYWLYRRKQYCLETALRDIQLSGKDVLDIGCGTGFFVKWYLERGANVCGIDITDVSIQSLKQRYAGEFHTQDISAIDYPTLKKFDIINMWDVVYHIVDPEAFNRTFKNIASSLKDGGLLLFTDWFGAPNDAQIADHVQARCLSTYTNSLPKMGFQLIKAYPLYKTLNKANWGRFDNYLGWLYFQLDNFAKDISTTNLSLSAWRYKSSS